MGIAPALGVAAAGLPPAGDQANGVLAGQITAVGVTPPFAIRGPMNLALWNSINTALTTIAGSLNASFAAATGLAAGTAVNSVNVPPGTVLGSVNGGAKTGVLSLPPVTLRVIQASTSSPNITLPPGSNVASLVGATVTIPSTKEKLTLPANTTVLAVVQADIAPSLNGPGQPGIVQLSANPTAVPATQGPASLTHGPNLFAQFAVGAAAITVGGADNNATFTDAAATWGGTVQLERSFDGGKTFLCCNIGGSGILAQYASLSSVQLTFGEPEKEVLYRLNCTVYSSGTINYRISATGAAAESLAIATMI